MSNSQNELSYKGYFGSAEISAEDKCLVGRILYIDDLVVYESQTYLELADSFKRSVDEYLAYCKEVGKEPQKTYSGSFNVRIGPALHSLTVKASSRLGSTLNEFVKQAIEKRVRDIDVSVGFESEVASSASSQTQLYSNVQVIGGSQQIVYSSLDKQLTSKSTIDRLKLVKGDKVA